MADMRFFSLISEKEKEQTAKDILCFIFLLNKEHLLKHLNSIEENKNEPIEANLEKRCSEIKNFLITN